MIIELRCIGKSDSNLGAEFHVENSPLQNDLRCTDSDLLLQVCRVLWALSQN